ncbi:hypothetical protein JW859_02380 [bacterium]|nr:hypothetical protein [bacterium]
MLLIALALLALGCGGRDGQLIQPAPQPELGPAPAQAELEQLLSSELARLAIDPARQPAAAPDGEANVVFDLSAEINTGDPPTITFYWTERMLGDYNQDGLVSVNDLTPIGQHYNEEVHYDDAAAHDGIEYWPAGDPLGDGAANWRVARVDGNSDGLVYLTDITTIAQHWNERLDGYRIYYVNDDMAAPEMIPNPAEPTAAYTVPRSAADPADANRPFRYSVSWVPTISEGVYAFYVVPYDAAEDDEGTPSLPIYLPEGDPPVADLTADVTTGNPPLTVNFDASGSTDPDGEIVQFAWDFDGDGDYDQNTDEPLALSVYEHSGDIHPRVRVMDNMGRQDTASITIHVNWAPVATITMTPAEPTAVPFDTSYSGSLSADLDGEIVQYDWDWDGDGTYDIIDGGADPAFSHSVDYPSDYTVGLRVIDNQGLEGTDTLDFSGLYGTWEITELDTENEGGNYCSLAVVDGYPAISYHSVESACLKYIRADDPFGENAWSNPVTLTIGVGDEGQYTSLAVINGNPAIAYYDAGNTELRYIRANNATGNVAGDWPVSLDGTLVRNGESARMDMEEVAGRPAIAYQTGGDDIYYQRADDANGDSWTSLPRDIDTQTGECFYPSMAIINGYPGVAFMLVTTTSTVLYYVHATDSAGADPWNDPVGASSHPSMDSGFYPWLAEVAGHPAMSFSMGNYGTLTMAPYFIRSTSTTGLPTTWNTPGPYDLTHDDPHNGWSTSLAVVNGYPHIVYKNHATRTLWHVWGIEADGSDWLEPTLVDEPEGGGIGLGFYCSLADVNGHPGVAYYDGTAANLKFAILR